MVRLISMFSIAALCAFNCLANKYTFTGTSGGEAQKRQGGRHVDRKHIDHRSFQPSK